MLTVESLGYHTSKKALLKEVSLRFQPGHLYGILGSNGSGKSSLLKSICKIWKPTQGGVFWKGEDLHKKSRKEISKVLTLVFHDANFHLDFTVNSFVQMGLYSSGFKEKEKEVKEALALVHADHLQEFPVSELSQGEKQRVCIAQAMMTAAPVLLLDEPTASLDIKHQKEIWQLLGSLALKGKIVIVASHDLEAIRQHCHEAIVLKQGQCITRGCPSQVLATHLVDSYFD